MNAATSVLLGRLRHSPSQVLLRVGVMTIAIGMLGAMLLFVSSSLRDMTSGAVRSSPIHWQGPVGSRTDAERIARDTAHQHGVKAALPVATAPFAGAAHASSLGRVQAGAGALLAVPPAYLRQFHSVRMLRGSLTEGAVVLDQQLAATLQAQPGDTIELMPAPGSAPVKLTVSGIGLVANADTIFQPLNPQVGPGPAQPPAEIALMTTGTFDRLVAPSLRLATGSTTSQLQPGTLSATQWQVQALVDPAAISGTPRAALATATGIRHRVERSLPGRVQFVDNLADTALTGAASDSLYAEALYIMLALPGALIALGLAYLAALGTLERDRQDIRLLRARGASRRALLGAIAVESLVIGTVAGLLGMGLAFVSVQQLVRGGLHPSTLHLALTVLACLALAIVGAFAARLAAAGAQLGRQVDQGARTGGRAHRPLWQRLYVDIIALVISGLVFWLTARTGFSAVVTPDSNPTLSLAAYMFLAPALLWVGATLLLVRLRGRTFSWLARLASRGGRVTMGRLLVASAARRGPQVNRGLVATGMLLAFGVSLGMFAATYDQQARVDAQLTLGADVTATAPAGAVLASHLERKIAHVRGVAGTTPVDHDYAYVGPDLQDTYGVDPRTIGSVTGLRDSYFVGGTAAGLMKKLAARPDAILVSKETVTDYQLRVGDLLRLRVLDRRSGAFKVAPFHVVGVVQEFPSAPKDSFMVANLGYLTSVTHGTGPNAVFARTTRDPVAVARDVRRAVASSGVQVGNIRDQVAQTTSTITTVDLAGVSSIERAFAVLLAAAAMTLVIGLSVEERRLELATMRALGASVRTAAAFLWTEAALVLAASVVLAALLGWTLSQMLVAMLQHVFDPPPDHMAYPWGFLASLGGAALVGFLLAAAAAVLLLRRLQPGTLLREE